MFIQYTADFFLTAPRKGAMTYFDSAIGNGILSVHYQIMGGCRNLGDGDWGSALISSAVGQFQYEMILEMINLLRKLILQY